MSDYTNKLITATETRDADALLSLYDENAQLNVYDKNRPPSAPTVLKGIDQISTMITDVMGRDMTHRITKIVTSDNGLAWMEECEYPDGVGVVRVRAKIT